MPNVHCGLEGQLPALYLGVCPLEATPDTLYNGKQKPLRSSLFPFFHAKFADPAGCDEKSESTWYDMLAHHTILHSC